MILNILGKHSAELLWCEYHVLFSFGEPVCAYKDGMDYAFINEVLPKPKSFNHIAEWLFKNKIVGTKNKPKKWFIDLISLNVSLF